MKSVLTIILTVLVLPLYAVTYVYFQNNSSLNFTINRVQFGTHIMSPGEWGFTGNSVTAWQRKTELMWTNRDQGVHNGDDFYFDVTLRNGSDSFKLRLHLNGNFVGSDMWHSASGPGFSHNWFNDRNFHTASFNMGGKQFTLKYTAVFTGGDDDIEYALQEENAWSLNPSDTANANVLNVLAYNIYMLTPPIASTDQTERATEIWKHIHGYDAIIFSEAFYNSARDNNLIPGINAEYPYHTPVVDKGTFNDDGGVFIASRWPIDSFAQIVFDDCDGSDCLAAKGVMYAKINKLGKKYHLFGSHTQAWNDPQNVSTRVLQFLQLNSFIEDLNIPLQEPVIIGGDLNVDKILNNLNEYPRMLDTLDVLEPLYLGNPYTYDGNLSYYTDPYFEYLDYVFTKKSHFSPNSATNEVIILRSIADPLWDIFDLSDHFAVRGRFEFPNIITEPLSQSICEGESLLLTAGLSVNATYQWFQNGQSINAANNDSLYIAVSNTVNSGIYHCIMTYNNGSISSDSVLVSVMPRPSTPLITQIGDFFYSNLGPQFQHQWYLDGQIIQNATDTFHQALASGTYSLMVDSAGCSSSFSNSISYTNVSNSAIETDDVKIYPNPCKNLLYFSSINDDIIESEIFDLNSKLVVSQIIKEKNAVMDIEHLTPSLYLIRCIKSDGSIQVFKIQKL